MPEITANDATTERWTAIRAARGTPAWVSSAPKPSRQQMQPVNSGGTVLFNPRLTTSAAVRALSVMCANSWKVPVLTLPHRPTM